MFSVWMPWVRARSQDRAADIEGPARLQRDYGLAEAVTNC